MRDIVGIQKGARYALFRIPMTTHTKNDVLQAQGKHIKHNGFPHKRKMDTSLIYLQ